MRGILDQAKEGITLTLILSLKGEEGGDCATRYMIDTLNREHGEQSRIG